MEFRKRVIDLNCKPCPTAIRHLYSIIEFKTEPSGQLLCCIAESRDFVSSVCRASCSIVVISYNMASVCKRVLSNKRSSW